jgi:UDP-4-amino-4-deoxy-L-arabinose formyltransferase / UDP-glucuronic acid dehydrogenase (UDP-4-keto-hexauronic acid decarboxylating)
VREAAPDQQPAFDDPWLDELAVGIWSKPEFSMIPIDLEEVPAGPYAGPRLDDRGLRVVFCGIPSDYGTAFLLHLIEKRVNLVAAVCSTRWQRTHPKADLVARIAGHLGRPVEVTANANAEPFTRSLRAYRPDVVVMASFDQILAAETLAVPSRGWLNIHPSLLPRHRGPEPIYWTIVNGDADAGITVHLTVPRIDAGPILAQRRIAVSDDETAGTLSKRLVAEGLFALDETLARLEAGKAEAIPSDIEQGSYEPPVRHTELNWDQPFQQIDRLVRAGHPDQPPYFSHRGQRRYVYGIRRVNPDSVNTERLKRSHGTKAPLAWAGGPGDEMLAAVRDAIVAVRWRPVGHTHAVRPLAKQQFP